MSGGSSKSMSIIETIIELPIEHEGNVFGAFDSYVKIIERHLNVTVIARDSSGTSNPL